MKSGPSEAVSEAGVGWLRFAIANRLGWIFREQSNQDKGVDAHVEEVVDGQATGRLIGLQIKSGASWTRERGEKEFVFRGDFEHLTYWRGHSLPIILVIFDPNAEDAYWQLVSEKHIRMTKRGWTINVPFSQQITAETIFEWSRICSPDFKRDFLRRKQRFIKVSRAFETDIDRRQTLVYEALHQAKHSLLISSPLVSEDVIAILDYVAVKCPVRLVVGPSQSESVWRIIRSRARQGFEIKVCPNLHLKQIVFDSLLVMTSSANLAFIDLHKNHEVLDVNEARSEEALGMFFDLWNGKSEPVFDPADDSVSTRQFKK